MFSLFKKKEVDVFISLVGKDCEFSVWKIASFCIQETTPEQMNGPDRQFLDRIGKSLPKERTCSKFLKNKKWLPQN